MLRILPLSFLLLASLPRGLASAEDPYERYVRTSEDFRPVKQDPAWARRAWPGWINMPWTYQWTIGYTPQSAAWSLANGYNGAFLDHQADPAKLAWIDQFHLRFYLDHTAGKGDLHLWDGNLRNLHLKEITDGAVRPRPLNDAMLRRLEGIVERDIRTVKGSPRRAAYALDDETSWGSFVSPCMWRATDDPATYTRWLREIYGPTAPTRDRWIGYDDIRGELAKWNLAGFDASPLMDQWTFNDAIFCNFIGSLVEFANRIDPDTPAGIVGGQSPNAFGGYDYARLMRKVQFIEAYDLGSSQAVIRSFNPDNALPQVTSEFHSSAAQDIRRNWYYLAHGNRGFIDWVENWFDARGRPAAWQAQVGPDNAEIVRHIAPRMRDARWIHDGVALYYSHPSIQMSWILDSQPFGRTWRNRNNDHLLGSSHRIRLAWENMLRDSGVQYSFVSYVDLLRNPEALRPYRVLILDAALCLSDAEARKIREFCAAGGAVIADYMPGLWDQHGKGRAGGGVLDDLFGVRHDPAMTQADVFDGGRWAETEQNLNYSKGDVALLTNGNRSIRDFGFDRAVRNLPVRTSRRYGNGTAVLMNLSPQWYNVCRERGRQAAEAREVFLRPILDAGIVPPIELKGSEDRTFGAEITRLACGDRTFVFVCMNPETRGSELGGGDATGLKTDTVPVTVTFRRPVRDVRDERSGKSLGDGESFRADWKMNEAVVLSFAGRM